MTEVKNFFIYWPGKHYLGSGGQFQQNIHREIHRGTSHWGAWTECVNLREFKSRKSKTKMASDKVFFKISATDSIKTRLLSFIQIASYIVMTAYYIIHLIPSYFKGLTQLQWVFKVVLKPCDWIDANLKKLLFCAM